MIAAIEDVGVVGRAVVVPCGRRSQEAARAVALAVTVPQLLDEGCDQLLIEARTPAQDGRDRALILDLLHGHPSRPAYDWRKKGEELLWIADAIGGAIHDHLRGLDDQWYERMAKATGLVVEYRMLPAAETSPKSRQSRLPS